MLDPIKDMILSRIDRYITNTLENSFINHPSLIDGVISCLPIPKISDKKSLKNLCRVMRPSDYTKLDIFEIKNLKNEIINEFILQRTLSYGIAATMVTYLLIN